VAITAVWVRLVCVTAAVPVFPLHALNDTTNAMAASAAMVIRDRMGCPFSSIEPSIHTRRQYVPEGAI